MLIHTTHIHITCPVMACVSLLTGGKIVLSGSLSSYRDYYTDETRKHDCSWLNLLIIICQQKIVSSRFCLFSIVVLLMAVCVFLDRPNKLKNTNIITHIPSSHLPTIIQILMNVCLCHSSQKPVSACVDVNTENSASEYLHPGRTPGSILMLCMEGENAYKSFVLINTCVRMDRAWYYCHR